MIVPNNVFAEVSFPDEWLFSPKILCFPGIRPNALSVYQGLRLKISSPFLKDYMYIITRR